MGDERPATLRELELRFTAMEKLEAERWAAANKALELQATVYGERLDRLNGEAGRLAMILASTIPRETFEQYRTYQEDRSANYRRVQEDKLTEMRRQMWGFMIAAIGTGASIGAALVKVV